MREYSTNERKLNKAMNSRWFTWGMALFWTLFACNDYRDHQLSWFTGFVAGGLITLGLIELIMFVIYRHRKNTTG